MRLLVALIIAVIGGQGLTGGQTYTLKDKTSSFVLTEKGYPVNDFDLEVVVNCVAPGRVLDTMGIDAAPVGSWCVEITSSRQVAFYVFDGSNWNIAVANNLITLGQEQTIHVVRQAGTIALSVNGSSEAQLKQGTPLSGRRIYVGDYKGDERFGSGYNISSAMTGTVRVAYFGAVRAGASAPAGAVFRPGKAMVFYQVEAKLFMTATFDVGKVAVSCTTAQNTAARTFKGALNPGTPKDDRPWGTASFEGGGGGEVFYLFDTGGRSVTTYWQPNQGPAKWITWVRVAKIGDPRRATPDEIESLNGGGQ